MVECLPLATCRSVVPWVDNSSTDLSLESHPNPERRSTACRAKVSHIAGSRWHFVAPLHLPRGQGPRRTLQDQSNRYRLRRPDPSGTREVGRLENGEGEEGRTKDDPFSDAVEHTLLIGPPRQETDQRPPPTTKKAVRLTASASESPGRKTLRRNRSQVARKALGQPGVCSAPMARLPVRGISLHTPSCAGYRRARARWRLAVCSCPAGWIHST